jgi:hypothetical protein
MSIDTMNRAVLALTVIAGLLVARAMHAAPSQCAPAAIDASLRSFAVELGDAGDSWTRRLATGSGTGFLGRAASSTATWAAGGAAR